MSCKKISVQSVSQIWTLHYSLLSEECMKCMKERPIMRNLPHNVNARSTQSQTNLIPEDNQLITRKEQILVRYPDVFEGIGKFPGKPYEIQLDPKVPPKQTPCRPIPIHLKDAFKHEIDKILKAGVLKLYKGTGSNTMDQQLCACQRHR